MTKEETELRLKKAAVGLAALNFVANTVIAIALVVYVVAWLCR